MFLTKLECLKKCYEDFSETGKLGIYNVSRFVPNLPSKVSTKRGIGSTYFSSSFAMSQKMLL